MGGGGGGGGVGMGEFKGGVNEWEANKEVGKEEGGVGGMDRKTEGDRKESSSRGLKEGR